MPQSALRNGKYGCKKKGGGKEGKKGEKEKKKKKKRTHNLLVVPFPSPSPFAFFLNPPLKTHQKYTQNPPNTHKKTSYSSAEAG